jgi:hypothetical protein
MARLRKKEITHKSNRAGTDQATTAVMRRMCFGLRSTSWARLTSFAEALERSLDFAGPANYCPILVGAIAGARWGASAIPEPALAHAANLTTIRKAADALAAGWTA